MPESSLFVNSATSCTSHDVPAQLLPARLPEFWKRVAGGCSEPQGLIASLSAGGLFATITKLKDDSPVGL